MNNRTFYWKVTIFFFWNFVKKCMDSFNLKIKKETDRIIFSSKRKKKRIKIWWFILLQRLIY